MIVFFIGYLLFYKNYDKIQVFFVRFLVSLDSVLKLYIVFFKEENKYLSNQFKRSYINNIFLINWSCWIVSNFKVSFVQMAFSIYEFLIINGGGVFMYV